MIFKVFIQILLLFNASNATAIELTVNQVETRLLHPNHSLDFTIAPSDTPQYVVVSNRGIDTYGTINHTEKKQVAASWMGASGSYLLYLPPTEQTTRLEIDTVESTGDAGTIHLQLISMEKLALKQKQAIANVSKAMHMRFNDYQKGTSAKSDKAIQLFTQSAKDLQNFNMPQLSGVALFEAGAALAEKGQHERAVIQFEQAHQNFETDQSVELSLLSLNQMSLSLLELQQLEQAQKTFSYILSKAESHELDHLVQFASNNLGLINLQSGEFFHAIHYFIQSLDMDFSYSTLEQAKMTAFLTQIEFLPPSQTAPIINNLAMALDAIGLAQQAELLWQHYLKISENLSDAGVRAQAQNNLAVLLINQGKYELARKYLQDAVQTFKRLKRPKWSSLAEHNLGQLYQELGLFDLAVIQFERALDKRSFDNNPKGRMESLLKLAEIAIDRENNLPAQQFLSEVEAIAQRINNNRGQVMVNFYQHQLALLNNDIPLAQEKISKAISLAKGKSYQRLLAKLYVAQAHIDIKQNQLNRAIKTLQNQVNSLIKSWDNKTLNQARNLLALALFKNKQVIHANQVMSDEISDLEKYIRVSTNHKINNSLLLRFKTTMNMWAVINQNDKSPTLSFEEYNQHISMIHNIRKSDNTTENEQTAGLLNLLESKSFALENPDLHPSVVKQLNEELIELKSQFEFSFSVIQGPNNLTRFSLSGLQSRLAEDTLMIQFSTGETESISWWVTKNEIKRYQLPAKSSLLPMITSSIKELKSDTTGFNHTVALSKILLSPLNSFEHIDTIIIIPDEPLNLIPFTAMADPRFTYKKPLAENSLVYRSLSAKSYFTELQQAKEKLRKILVISDPVTNIDDSRLSVKPDVDTFSTQFPRLYASAIETSHIQQFSDAESLTGFTASKAQLNRTRLDDKSVLHFATHAFFNQTTPDLSAMVLSTFTKDGKRQPAFVRAYEIKTWNLNTDLVVLSGCETGLQGIDSSYGLGGLSKSFLEAGSKQLISSLWRVDDAITSRLMNEFYHQYSQGQPAVISLAKAQAKVRSNPHTSHPKYWAGWFLIKQ